MALSLLSAPAVPRTRLGRAATFAFGATLVGVSALASCSDDDTDPRRRGEGGSAGTGATGGTENGGASGSTAGQGGSAGSSGSAGAGGSAGSGGSAGASGAWGDGGPGPIYGAPPG